ncbi:adenylate/guanylate cyclase domain-containing protein [Chryseobacterium sp. Leaf394]|uniref:adenylate/guanylate cyclase domain-containing protein n=1 Tax=Chryseobacterium sp. Leaf394 TaxID=1736361 RepID=UPI000FF8A158|nr:adenylate/guanylate cyclase domain-containing protein [Chryseobacterium sp. Leaf394]
MKKHLFFTFLFLLGMQTFCFAQNSREKPKIFNVKEITEGVSIDEAAKFLAGDNPKFSAPDFDDSAWTHVDFSSKKSYKKDQVYWIRYYFKIDSATLNKPLCFDIGQNGASEIYLNGRKIESIGKIGDEKTRSFKMNNEVPELFSLDNTEVNVLAIRFLPNIDADKMAINFRRTTLNINLNSANEFMIDMVEMTEGFNFITMLICGVFSALGFIHLLLFLFYRKAVYNLYFSIYNFSIGLLSYMVLSFYQMTDPADVDTCGFLSFLSILAFGASLTGFINTLFGRSKLRLKILLIIAAIILTVYYFSAKTAISFVSFYISFVWFESLYLIIRAMIRKEKSAFIVGGGILTFFGIIILAIILNILDSLNVAIPEIMLGDTVGIIVAVLIFASFPLSISAYLGWQFASTNLSLVKQLDEVNRLSDINLKQEQEKQQILQDQNDLLEKQVDERTFELQNEKQKTENLLLNILPHEVAEELKENGSSEAKYYDEVTVLFTDFVNFTQSSERMGAEKMLVELNECFTAFDMIMEKHGLEKIKTIGDAYLAVCGLPIKNENHAYQTVLVALDIIEFIEERKKTHPEALDIRVGINSGSLIAGIVGVKKFAYDIWGDTVNTAARMEQNSEKGKINISESTYQLVKDKVHCEYRGKIHTKGKGDMDMYFALETKKD